MTPSVEAALVAGGGTMIVAIASLLIIRAVTRQTIQSGTDNTVRLPQLKKREHRSRDTRGRADDRPGQYRIHAATLRNR